MGFLASICRMFWSNLYAEIIKNKEKVKAYRSNLSSWETQLNDQSRMLINSIRGSIDATKHLSSSGRINNISRFRTYIQKTNPRVYNTESFKMYMKQIIYLQGKIRYEKQVINNHTRFYNESIQNNPSLAKIWEFDVLPYESWNDGRDVPLVTREYNNINNQQF
jgi:hypothetical protein